MTVRYHADNQKDHLSLHPASGTGQSVIHLSYEQNMSLNSFFKLNNNYL